MAGTRRQKWLSLLLVNGTLLLMVLLWTVLTAGFSFPPGDLASTSSLRAGGRSLPHREWQTVETLDPREMGLDATGPMQIRGIEATFEELRAGVATPDGATALAGQSPPGPHRSSRARWTVNWDFTTENYGQVLQGKDFEYVNPTARLR